MGLAPTGLAAVRALGSMGVPCLGIYWSPRREVGRHSKYLLRASQVPYPPSHQQLLETLGDLTAPWQQMSPLLIPASDVYARFIGEMHDELRARYTVRCSADHHVTFIDKVRTISVCNDHQVAIPRSLAIDKREDIGEVCGEFRFPVIVKPRTSHGTPFEGKNFVAHSRQELVDFFARRSPLVGQTVAQEVIDSGDGNRD